jgi:hypothetical protein
MLAGCRRAAEAAGDAGERPRRSASAAAVLPSAGGVGCEIAEPLVDPFGSFAGARSRRRRPRMIMWCPQQSRTTYSPPGRGGSSLFLQVSRGTWESPSRFAVPTVPPQPTPLAPRACSGSCRPPRGSLRKQEPCPVNVVSETTNLGRFTWNVGNAPGPSIRAVSRGTWPPQASTRGRSGCSAPPPIAPSGPLAEPD